MTKMGGKLKGKEKKANDYHKVLPGTRDKFFVCTFSEIQREKSKTKMQKYEKM